MSDCEEPPALHRIESWIAEIVRKERETLPPSGTEPLDLGQVEGSLRLPAPPELPPARNEDAA